MNSIPSPFGACVDAFDPCTILGRLHGDQALLLEVIDLFLADCPQMLLDVRDALARGDARQLEMSAHRLRGAFANFGFTSATETAKQLEHMGNERRLEPAAPVLTALEPAVDRLVTSLREYAQQNAPQPPGDCS